MGVTEAIARFVGSADLGEMPDDVIRVASHAITDCVGCMLAGAGEPVATVMSRYAAGRGSPNGVRVLGTDLRVDAETAALVMGTLGHALDYDDANTAMHGHPSVAVLPAVLALGDELGCSGAQVLEAYVVGTEVACQLGAVYGDDQYARGWHATSTLGTMGAAAATAKLLGLDEGAVKTTLGIAASMACGLRQNFGTMTKPLHAGLAARNGVLAARLASLGLTAHEGVVEAPWGFARTLGGSAPECDFGSILGRRYALLSPGMIFKKYPGCALLAQPLDATFELIARYDVMPEQIDVVRAGVYPYMLQVLMHNRPKTGLEAKFSLQYAVAAALVFRRAGLTEFTDSKVRDERVQALIDRIEVFVHPDQRDNRDLYKGFTELTIRTQAGESYTARVDLPKGYPGNPLTEQEIQAKFLDCAGAVLDAGGARRVLTVLADLRQVGSIRELFSIASKKAVR